MFLTKYSSKTLLWLVVCLFCIGITSCNKDEMGSFSEEEMPNEKMPPTSTLPYIIQLEDDYLVFVDNTHFDNTLKELNHKSVDELDEWEQSLGFKSVRYYQDQAIQEISASETKADFERVHQKYANKVRFNENGTIDMLINIPVLSKVLNLNGLVKIGDLLHQYSENKVVAVIGDKTKLKAAQNRTETDEDSGIYIGKVESTPVSNEKTASQCSFTYTTALGNTALSTTETFCSNFNRFFHQTLYEYNPSTGTFEYTQVTIPYTAFFLSYRFQHLHQVNGNWQYTPVQLYQYFNYTFESPEGFPYQDKYKENMIVSNHFEALAYVDNPIYGLGHWLPTYFTGLTHLTVPGAPPGQRGCFLP